MRVWAWVFVLMGSGCGESTWYAHPCGNGSPVEIQCEDEADVVWQEPSTELCSDRDVSVGDVCDDTEDACVLLRGFSCTSMPDGPAVGETFLSCRSQPFEDGNCPQSSRDVKREIAYVKEAERNALAQEILSVKLARYHYVDPTKPGRKLGYILEDQPHASFSGEGRVDLYAYMSAVVALAQEQQVQIEALKAELAALKDTP